MKREIPWKMLWYLQEMSEYQMNTENVYAHTRLNVQKDKIKMVIVCHVSRNFRLWVQFDKFPLITILLLLNFFN